MPGGGWGCLVRYDSKQQPRIRSLSRPFAPHHTACRVTSARARVLKKSVPASGPAKCQFGTIWVLCQEHPSLTHNFKSTVASSSQQAESTQICYQRQPKVVCVSRRARACTGGNCCSASPRKEAYKVWAVTAPQQRRSRWAER